VYQVLQQTILPAISEKEMAPFLPLMMAHVRCAGTHLMADVRLDGLRFLEALVHGCPKIVATQYKGAVLQLFAAALSQVRLLYLV
jgi:hypothetical protein